MTSIRDLLRSARDAAVFTAKYRLTGRTKLDYFADMNDRLQADRTTEPFGDAYLERSHQRMDYLIERGLKPHHRLLDYGCGGLRLARLAVPYLKDGQYVGADAARHFMQRGVNMLTEHGIDRYDYQLVLIRDYELTDLVGFQFDMAITMSTLQYVPDDDLIRVMAGIRRHLDGTLLYNFPVETEREEVLKKGHYFRSEEFIDRTLSPLGYDIEFDASYPGGMAIMRTR